MNQPGKAIEKNAMARGVKRDLWIMLIAIAVGTLMMAAAAGYFGTAGSWFERSGKVLLILGSLAVLFLGCTVLGSYLGSRMRKGGRLVMLISGIVGMLSGLLIWFFAVLQPMFLYVL
jgi:hypothetical protein